MILKGREYGGSDLRATRRLGSRGQAGSVAAAFLFGLSLTLAVAYHFGYSWKRDGGELGARHSLTAEGSRIFVFKMPEHPINKADRVDYALLLRFGESDVVADRPLYGNASLTAIEARPLIGRDGQRKVANDRRCSRTDCGSFSGYASYPCDRKMYRREFSLILGGVDGTNADRNSYLDSGSFGLPYVGDGKMKRIKLWRGFRVIRGIHYVSANLNKGIFRGKLLPHQFDLTRCSISRVPSRIRTFFVDLGLADKYAVRNNTRNEQQSGKCSNEPIRPKLAAIVFSLGLLVFALLAFYFFKSAIDQETVVVW